MARITTFTLNNTTFTTKTDKNGKAFYTANGKRIKVAEYETALTKYEASEPAQEKASTPIIWTVRRDNKGDDIYRVNGKIVFAVCNPNNRTGKVSIYLHSNLNPEIGTPNGNKNSKYSRRLTGPKDEVFHQADAIAKEWAKTLA